MKNLFLLVIFLFPVNVFAQNIVLKADVSSIYRLSGNFNVTNQSGEIVFTFNRKKKLTQINGKKDTYLLLKRKYLVHENDTVAFYRNNKIYFPEENIVVKEKTTKTGWTYFINDKKTVQISYTEDKTKRLYSIKATLLNADKNTLNLLRISLGKFDKRVIMDYENDDYGCLYGIIAGVLIAK